MIDLGATLVVDDSKVYLKLMATLLRPHASEVLTATTVRGALAILDARSDIDLVLCDVVMGEENGFEFLESVASCEPPRPRVIMVSGYRDASWPERAARLGAAGYLPKPTRLREITEALQTSPHAEQQLSPRFRCVGAASLLDPESQANEFLAWDLYNIGPEGAFLETKGPLPVGEEMDLLLEVAGRRARVRARVVRVQEPSWLDVGGVGISFVEVGEEARRALDAAIAEGRTRDRGSEALARRPGGAADRAPQDVAQAPTETVLDAAAVAQIRGLDPEGRAGLLARMVGAYTSSTPGQVEALVRANEKGDASAMAMAAHALKSSSACVGALRLSQLCAEVEALGRSGSMQGAESLVEELRIESERVALAVEALQEE